MQCSKGPGILFTPICEEKTILIVNHVAYLGPIVNSVSVVSFNVGGFDVLI